MIRLPIVLLRCNGMFWQLEHFGTLVLDNTPIPFLSHAVVRGDLFRTCLEVIYVIREQKTRPLVREKYICELFPHMGWGGCVRWVALSWTNVASQPCDTRWPGNVSPENSPGGASLQATLAFDVIPSKCIWRCGIKPQSQVGSFLPQLCSDNQFNLPLPKRMNGEWWTETLFWTIKFRFK